MPAILKVDKITKNFGGLMAVDHVDFTTAQGARQGIIGPNGAGKTTLFNLITGEIKPTSGTISLEGEAIQGLKPHKISKRGVGRTFQLVRIFDQLTVYDNVMMGAISHELHARPTAEQHDLTADILEKTDLMRLKDTQASNLTVAAKKRVGLATALATRPRLLLLDELMAGLTFVEIDEVLDFLRMINSDMGITLIIVEHVMKAVMELCEEVIVISYGKKIASGAPDDIANNQDVIDKYLGEESR